MDLSLENLSSSETKEIYIEGNVQETGWDSIAKLKVGGANFIGFYVESLGSGDVWRSPVSIYIDGIKKGSTKLIIEVSEAGKESLRWEIPVMVRAY